MTHHTPSQSSCKELHTLLEARGEVMETEFYWVYDKFDYKQLKSKNELKKMLIEVGVFTHPAPLATEILERLPSDITQPNTHEECFFLRIDTSGYGKYKKWYVRYEGSTIPSLTAPTLAQAVTEMLIHLIKEELI